MLAHEVVRDSGKAIVNKGRDYTLSRGPRSKQRQGRDNHQGNSDNPRRLHSITEKAIMV
jgi:hypothetical protein